MNYGKYKYKLKMMELILNVITEVPLSVTEISQKIKMTPWRINMLLSQLHKANIVEVQYKPRHAHTSERIGYWFKKMNKEEQTFVLVDCDGGVFNTKYGDGKCFGPECAACGGTGKMKKQKHNSVRTEGHIRGCLCSECAQSLA